jgi:hypothetical protein
MALPGGWGRGSGGSPCCDEFHRSGQCGRPFDMGGEGRFCAAEANGPRLRVRVDPGEPPTVKESLAPAERNLDVSYGLALMPTAERRKFLLVDWLVIPAVAMTCVLAGVGSDSVTVGVAGFIAWAAASLLVIHRGKVAARWYGWRLRRAERALDIETLTAFDESLTLATRILAVDRAKVLRAKVRLIRHKLELVQVPRCAR